MTQVFGRVLSLAILLLALTGPAKPQTKDDEVQQHFQAGKQALEAGNVKAAVEEFKKVVALAPSLYQARVNLGLAYHAMGDLSHAVGELAAARKSNTEIGGANLILGSDYLALGKPALAIAPLQKAINDGIGGKEARAKLCTAFVKAERFADASRCGTTLYGAPPTDAAGWYQMGRQYLDSAQTLTWSMRERFPNDHWTKRMNGDVAAENKNWKLAQRFYGEAAAAKSSAADRTVEPGAAYVQKNDFGKAADVLERSPSRTPERSYWLMKAYLGLSNKCFNELLSRYPSSALAYRLRAESEEIADNRQAAIENYQKAVAIDKHDPTLRAALATLLLAQNRVPEAAKEAEAAFALQPNSPPILVLAGKIDLANGNARRAEERARQAIAAEPAYLPAHELLGKILWKKDDAAGASAELREALPLDHYGDLHYLLYRAYRKQGKTALAQQALEQSKRLRQTTLAEAQAEVAGGAPESER
jgi:tetratricopeptide (TPR) repeat protein